MKTKHIAAFIGLGLAWGSAFFWNRIALNEIGPFLLVAIRLLFGVISLLIAILILKPQMPKDKRVWLINGMLGLTNAAIPFSLTAWSGQVLESAMVSILVSIVPVFTAILAHFLIPDEKLNGKKLVAILGGFVGVVILFWPNLQNSTHAANLGLLAILGGSLFFAISAIITRRETSKGDPLVQSFIMLLGADIGAWAITLVLEPNISLPTQFSTWGALAFLGVFSSGLAYLLYYNLMAEIGPTRTMMVSYLMPVVGVVLGVAILGEHSDWSMLVGGAVVLVSIWVINQKDKKTPKVSLPNSSAAQQLSDCDI